MSSTEERPDDRGALPSFDLSYGFDDPDDPTEITVYEPAAEDVSTSWISADARYAVSLEDVA